MSALDRLPPSTTGSYRPKADDSKVAYYLWSLRISTEIGAIHIDLAKGSY